MIHLVPLELQDHVQEEHEVFFWISSHLVYSIYLSHATLSTFAITTCTGSCQFPTFFFFHFLTCHPGRNVSYIYLRMHTASLCALPHLGLQLKPGSYGLQALRPISSACLPLQCYRRAAGGAATQCVQTADIYECPALYRQTNPPTSCVNTRSNITD